MIKKRSVVIFSLHLLYCVRLGSDSTAKETFTLPKPESRFFRSKASLQRRKLVVHRTDGNWKKDTNATRGELDQQRGKKTKKFFFAKTERLTSKFYSLYYKRLCGHFKNSCFVTFVFSVVSHTTKRRGSCFPHLSRVWKPSG